MAEREPQRAVLLPTGFFAAGYLAAWGGFSAVAAGLQWGLEQLDLLGPMMTATNDWLGGAILVAAGIWQLRVPPNTVTQPVMTCLLETNKAH